MSPRTCLPSSSLLLLLPEPIQILFARLGKFKSAPTTKLSTTVLAEARNRTPRDLNATAESLLRQTWRARSGDDASSSSTWAILNLAELDFLALCTRHLLRQHQH